MSISNRSRQIIRLNAKRRSSTRYWHLLKPTFVLLLSIGFFLTQVPRVVASVTWATNVRAESEHLERSYLERIHGVVSPSVTRANVLQDDEISQSDVSDPSDTIPSDEETESSDTTSSDEETELSDTTSSDEETESSDTTSSDEETEPSDTTSSDEETEPSDTTSSDEETESSDTTSSDEETEPSDTMAPRSSSVKYNGTLFGMNDNSGYNSDRAFNKQASQKLRDLGLQLARMGADGIGCRNDGDECDFTARDGAIDEHLKAGIGVHMVLSFRAHVSSDGGEDRWVKNYGWFCKQVASRYRNQVKYYIVDNEPDIDYGDGQGQKVAPPLLVKMQRACYQAIKQVDRSILVESSPATSPETEYNQEILKAGIGNYADIIGTHMYGGQLGRDSIAKLRGYMRSAGIDKPIAISESGVTPEWYQPGKESHEGKFGKEARAQWLQDMGRYAIAKKLHNVLFFSMFGPHGEWEMHEDPLAMNAIEKIGGLTRANTRKSPVTYYWEQGMVDARHQHPLIS